VSEVYAFFISHIHFDMSEKVEVRSRAIPQAVSRWLPTVVMNAGPVGLSSIIVEFPEQRFAVLLFIIQGAPIRLKNWVGLTTWPSRHLKISGHTLFCCYSQS
jgi:hypothetical protein